jgi:hypothetical protein
MSERMRSRIDGFWRRATIHFFLPAAAIGFAVGLMVCAIAYLETRPDTTIAQETIDRMNNISLVVCPPSLGLMASEGAGKLGFLLIAVVIAMQNAIFYGMGGLVLSLGAALWSRRSPVSIPERNGKEVETRGDGFWLRALTYFVLPFAVIGFGMGLLVCGSACLLTSFDVAASGATTEVMTYTFAIVCPSSIGLTLTPDSSQLGLFVVVYIATRNAFLYGEIGLLVSVAAAFWSHRSSARPTPRV